LSSVESKISVEGKNKRLKERENKQEDLISLSSIARITSCARFSLPHAIIDFKAPSLNLENLRRIQGIIL
jgi:hypothetical protein